MAADVDIVIVNWNSGAQLRDCLLSIQEHAMGSVKQTIIIDNASSDNSLAGFGKLAIPVHIISNKENRGFSAACNQGAALAGSNYLLFLNPDTRLLKNSLAVPLAFMDQPENAGVGICGIQLIDESGHVSHTCARYPSVSMFAAEALGVSKLPGLRLWNHHMAEWDHGSTREVDHVIGAFYLMRRSLFHELGGFDERFFVYLEDLDLSLRAHRAGWKSIFLADARAFHAGGGTSAQVKARRLFYALSSRLIYGFKHFSAGRAALLLAVTMLIEPVSRTMFSLLRGKAGDVQNTLAAYAMLWRDLPSIFKRGMRQA